MVFKDMPFSGSVTSFTFVNFSNKTGSRLKWWGDALIVMVSAVYGLFFSRRRPVAAALLPMGEPGALVTATADISAGLHEISIFIKVAAVLGVAVTLLLVVFSSCVGISLVRNQGMKPSCRCSKTGGRRKPGGGNGEKRFAGAGGLPAADPGFFTDFLGLLLLLPPVQNR